MTSHWFGDQVLKWYDAHGRKALPWKAKKSQHTNLSYHIWLSEIMLQQTQVATVIPYFEKFITRFPSIEKLATASIDEVIAHWAGLGYYARARNLHKSAKIIMREYQGMLPNKLESLKSLPGIGPSTAGAILAQSYNIRSPILDGNVKRVLCRFYGVAGWPGLKPIQDTLWALSDKVTPPIRPNDYTQGIMDVGALICKRSKPLCVQCPMQSRCVAFKQAAVDAYPERKAKVSKPIRQTQFVILVNQYNRILLLKRPPSGIWGGLWCLPENLELQNFKLPIKPLSTKSVRRHSFTHYHLDYETLLARTIINDSKSTVFNYENTHNWCTLSDIMKLGLPAPHKILITEFARECHDANCKLSKTQ